MNEGCVYHRRPAVAKVGVDGYCETCLRGIAAARKKVPESYPGAEWFIGYYGAPRRRWQPLPGSPAASWAARKIGVRMPGMPETTLDGYPRDAMAILWRVKPVADLAQVRVGDLYYQKPFGPIGVVETVGRAAVPGRANIAIAMFSTERGAMVVKDFRFDLRQKGEFFRAGK